jgi:hypothetical protein
MRWRIVTVPSLVSLLLAGTVLAQNQSNPQLGSPSEPRRVRSGKTVYDFDEVDILGKLKKPEVQPIVEPPEFRFRRLLDLDESFLPNIVRSVDEF